MSAVEELRAILGDLPPHRIQDLRDYAEFLRAKDRESAPVSLTDLFGTLFAERAAAMERAIREACEGVDATAW